MVSYRICPSCSRLDLRARGCTTKCFTDAALVCMVSSAALGLVLNKLKDSPLA